MRREEVAGQRDTGGWNQEGKERGDEGGREGDTEGEIKPNIHCIKLCYLFFKKSVLF